jgi:dTDP-4-dehydrorhamnose 3,5-epimerase
MKLIQTKIPDVVIVEPTVFGDERGWFMETFNEPRFHAELCKLGLDVPRPFVQDNHSCSHKNVLRGLHFQRAPHAQGKLVRVVKGAAFDVAVDIRPESATFGQWVGVELNEKNNRMLWIPEGFAHGFMALEDDTHFLYKTTDVYNKAAEGSLRWDDPTLAIEWPSDQVPNVSEKDQQAPSYVEYLDIAKGTATEVAHALMEFKVLGDDRGSLVALQALDNVPFAIKRTYYLTGTKPGVARGFHAHRSLKQLAVCVAGKCRMVMDDGNERTDYWLDATNKGIMIPPMVWHEMHDFSEDCVLLVLADAHYDESDYIRDYSAFKELKTHAKNSSAC